MNIRRIRTSGSVLTKKSREVAGTSPFATFILDDGTEIDVVHLGDHIEVRNPGRGGSKIGLTILPRMGNSIDIYGETR